MRYTTERPFAHPEKAARRLMEHAAKGLRAHPGRKNYIEKIDGPFLFGDKATRAECSAGLDYAIRQGWLELHESGTFVVTGSSPKNLGSGTDRCSTSTSPARAPHLPRPQPSPRLRNRSRRLPQWHHPLASDNFPVAPSRRHERPWCCERRHCPAVLGPLFGRDRRHREVPPQRHRDAPQRHRAGRQQPHHGDRLRELR